MILFTWKRYQIDFVYYFDDNSLSKVGSIKNLILILITPTHIYS